jgi:ribulose-phosphate 3-epimerase
MAHPLLAPSLLSADFGRLAQEVKAVEAAGADLLHCDVMDGRFVPNLTIGPLVVEAIKESATRPLDVHLMIVEPEKYIDAFAHAGAAWISVHAEACPHLHRTLQQIAHAGAKPGVVLNPATPLSAIEEVLGDVHHVLIMSVNPGFGGQSFIEASHDKVRRLHELRLQRQLPFLIEIDGGIKAGNARSVCAEGVDVLVAGSAVFDAEDYGAALRAIRDEAEAGSRARPGAERQTSRM